MCITEICILHKNKCVYLGNIPSCKKKKSVVFFRYKEEHLSKNQKQRSKQKGVFKKDKAFQNSDYINILYEKKMNAKTEAIQILL